MSFPAQALPDDGTPPDLRQIVARVFRRRWWVVASVVVCTAIAVTIAMTSEKVYRAEIVMIPASSDRNNMASALGSALGELGGLASLAGLGRSDDTTEESLAVLKSRQFTEKFIQDHSLITRLFPDKWDDAQKKWNVPETAQPTVGKAFKRFDRDIRSVIQDKKTGLVTLQVDWKDRREAASWANELVERLNAEMRNRAMRSADASVGYLEKELQSTTVVGTREAISRLIEAQVKQRMLANVTQEYAFRVVDAALPADADDPVKPKKLFIVIAGFLFGLVASILCILLFDVKADAPLREHAS
jgi:uncharacterized protein involved in exopolysaccharide biosynthesis